MRKEIIRCDACGKEWLVRDEHDNSMRWWDRKVRLISTVEFPMGQEETEDVQAELCDTCATAVSHVLAMVALFCSGRDPEALDGKVRPKSQAGEPDRVVIKKCRVCERAAALDLYGYRFCSLQCAIVEAYCESAPVEYLQREVARRLRGGGA